MSVFVTDNYPMMVNFAEGDIAKLMRKGHPQIAEGDTYIMRLVKQHCQRLEPPVRLLDVGCGTGYFASRLLKQFSEIELIAAEAEPDIVVKLERRLANTNAKVFNCPFEEWNEPVDIILSWGAHHHLPSNYLIHAKQVLKKDGVFIVGDEFCPDYCDETDAVRIANAELIYIANGYILTTAAEVENYKRSGEIPPVALEFERRRQQALWIWYRYVVDYAMERNCIEVAIDELRATYNDLMTGSGDEHKMSPRIAEQEFKLGGWRQLSKKSLGSANAPEFQSFVVYELEHQWA
ncbi:class I SAM-dependent methyltransferase [Coleofasciculus sp. F4-SAH-05]|uniref:class I SAM-dependent methyltransferase n=1 Tax=unclassified Coleofasciculus TaxID=2692782 RepID=UPI0032F41724